jgi:hypothetical protein
MGTMHDRRSAIRASSADIVGHAFRLILASVNAQDEIGSLDLCAACRSVVNQVEGLS